MSSAVFFILLVLYIIDLFYKISYPLVSPYFTWTVYEWYGVTVVFIVGVVKFVEEYEVIRLPRGLITQNGILLVQKNMITPFQKVEKINTRRRGISVMQTTEGEVEVRLNERDIVKLPRAGFTHWSIDKKSAAISRGPAGAELYVEYKPTGKYANRKISLCIFVISFSVLFTLAYFMIGSVDIIFSLPFSLLIILVYQDYKEVVVTIEDSGIKLRDENLVEHFMAFAEIDSVEKGWVRTMLTARDGRVMRLPRALYLLPEFIEEYARPRKA